MLRRFIESRLAGARVVASELLDGADSRARLLAAEGRREMGRWVAVAIGAVAAVMFSVVTLLWAAATVIMLCWDTPWRMHAIWGVMAFWVLASLIAIVTMRQSLAKGRDAFALSRRVLSEDVAMLKRNLHGEARAGM